MMSKLNGILDTQLTKKQNKNQKTKKLDKLIWNDYFIDPNYYVGASLSNTHPPFFGVF